MQQQSFMQLTPHQMVACGRGSGDVPKIVSDQIAPATIMQCGTQCCFRTFRKHTGTYRCSFCLEMINLQSPIESLIKPKKEILMTSVGMAPVSVDACCILCFPRFLMHYDSYPCTFPCCLLWHDCVASIRPVPDDVLLAIQHFARAVVMPNSVSSQMLALPASGSTPPPIKAPPAFPPPGLSSSAELELRIDTLESRVSELEAQVRALLLASSPP